MSSKPEILDKLLENALSLVRVYKNSRRDPDQRDYDRREYAHNALLALKEYESAGGTNVEALKHLAYFQHCYESCYMGSDTIEVKKCAVKNLRIASEGGDEEAKQMLDSLQQTGGRYIGNGVNYLGSKVGDDCKANHEVQPRRTHAQVEIEYCRRRLGMDLREKSADASDAVADAVADATNPCKKQRM